MTATTTRVLRAVSRLLDAVPLIGVSATLLLGEMHASSLVVLLTVLLAVACFQHGLGNLLTLRRIRIVSPVLVGAVRVVAPLAIFSGVVAAGCAIAFVMGWLREFPPLLTGLLGLVGMVNLGLALLLPDEPRSSAA